MRLAELCGLCHVLRPRGSLLAPLPSRLLVGWESAHGSPCSSPTDVLPSPPIPLSQQLKASQQEEAGKDATKISVSSNRGSDEVCAWGHRSPQRGTHCTEHRGLLHPGASFCPHHPNLGSAGPSSATLGAILWGRAVGFPPRCSRSSCAHGIRMRRHQSVQLNTCCWLCAAAWPCCVIPAKGQKGVGRRRAQPAPCGHCCPSSSVGISTCKFHCW